MAVKKLASTPAIDRIREIAHQLWLDAGKPEGESDIHWSLAEAIVTKEIEAPAAKKAPARKKAA